MKRILVGGGRLPVQKLTQAELLALQVIYGNDDQARQSWTRFRQAGFDIDSLYLTASRGLLPMLSQRVSKLFCEDPWLGKMRGYYRYIWTKNQFQLNAAINILRSFRDNQVESIMIADAAVLLGHYKDYGMRPIGTSSVLVGFSDYVKAVELARAAESVAVGSKENSERKPLVVYRSIYGLLYNLTEADSVPVTVKEQTIEILSAPLLLLSLLLAIKYDQPNQAQWFMDTALLLSSCNSDNDFEHLLEKVESARIAVPVTQAWIFFKQMAQTVYFETGTCKIAAAMDKTPVKMTELARRALRLK